MKCLCPKCTASIQVEDPAIPEKGAFAHCPECNGKFWVHRESFALRAYKKGGKVFCTHCGEEPGPDTFCSNCHVPFPDYWLVQTAKPARRQVRRLPSSLREAKVVVRKPTRPLAQKAKPSLKDTSAGRPVKKSFLVPVASVLVAIALVLVGVSLYLNAQREKEFSKNFVLTLYGIKSGTETSFVQLDTMLRSGLPLDGQVAVKLNSIKAEIDQYRQKLDMPPEKFQASTEVLSKYYNIYSGLNRLALSSSGSSPELPGQIESMKTSVKKAEADLKRNISAQLLDQVREVQNKYRNLQFMVQ